MLETGKLSGYVFTTKKVFKIFESQPYLVSQVTKIGKKKPKTRVAYTSGYKKWCQWLTIAKVQNSTYKFF